MKSPLLKVGPLTARRGNKILYQGLSLVLYPGEIVQLKGPSGCGKTTLLRQIVGLEKSEAKRILAGLEYSLSKIQHFRSLCVYLAPEAPVIEGDLRENLLFPFSFKTNQKKKKISPEALLKRLGLNYPLTTPAARLSTGERQRLALARALIFEPLVILADEPFSALDQENFEKAFYLLQAFAQKGKRAVLCVSHQELPKKTRTLTLKDGNLIESP